MASSIFFLISILIFTFFSISFSKTLFLPLTHSLSTSQFNSTPHHLLKSTSTHSTARFHHHHRRSRQISLPLSPGSDYTLSFTIGSNPPQPVSLYMDTGSDVVWFPCSPFECILCEGKFDPSVSSSPPNISAASAVNCMSPSCSAAHSSSSLSSSDLCAIAKCPLDYIETSDCSSFSCPSFYNAYGDGSFVANLYTDTLSLATESPSRTLKNFTFGCAHTTLAEPIGVAGFGRGLLSLPAQLAAIFPQFANQFSYCLVSHSFDSNRVRQPSPLILGRYDEDDKKVGYGDEFRYTKMLNNPKHPYFYLVGLEGISVGKRNIPAPAFLRRVDRRGSGGIVVDSGTTFTMLPSTLYDLIVAEFDDRVKQITERASDIEEKTGLGPCYYYNTVLKVPSVTFHFVGNKSSVMLPRRNYFYEFIDGGDGVGKKRNVGCMMLLDGGDEKELEGGPGGIFGNYQQQGFEVVYDLEKRRVGFARRQCALMWDSLNKR